MATDEQDSKKNFYQVIGQLWRNSPNPERIRAIIAICVLLFTLTVLFFGNNLLTSNSITRDAAIYLDNVQKSAATAFLVARSLNAIISVMQTVNIGASFGFSGNVSIGEALDPINDMIERFSWAMLTVTVAIGIQKFMMDVGITLNLSWIVIPMLLVILTRLCSQIYQALPVNKREPNKLKKAISIFSDEKYHNRLMVIPCKVLAVVLFIHFAIPLVGYINNQISSGYIAEQRNSTIAAIDKSKDVLDNTVTGKALISNFDRVEQVVMNESENIITNTIKLISLFVIETMILPLLLIYGLIKVMTWLIIPKVRLGSNI